MCPELKQRVPSVLAAKVQRERSVGRLAKLLGKIEMLMMGIESVMVV